MSMYRVTGHLWHYIDLGTNSLNTARLRVTFVRLYYLFSIKLLKSQSNHDWIINNYITILYLIKSIKRFQRINPF